MPPVSFRSVVPPAVSMFRRGRIAGRNSSGRRRGDRDEARDCVDLCQDVIRVAGTSDKSVNVSSTGGALMPAAPPAGLYTTDKIEVRWVRCVLLGQDAEEVRPCQRTRCLHN